MSSPSSSSTDFLAASIHMQAHQHLVQSLPTENKLTLYGLYKQATVGECTVERPTPLHVVERAKYDAWTAFKDMSIPQAQDHYVKLVQQLDPTFIPPSSSSTIPTTPDNNENTTQLPYDDNHNNNENESDNESEETNMDWDEEDDDNDDKHGMLPPPSFIPPTHPDNEDTHIFHTLLFHLPQVIFTQIKQLVLAACLLPLQLLSTRILGWDFQLPHHDNEASLRRKQNSAVLLIISIMPLTLIIYLWTFVLLIFPLTTLPTASYLAWALYVDDSPRTGKRDPYLRQVSLGQYFCQYFPISLIRASPPLDPSRKYVFVYSPHGIAGLGAFGAFATEAAGFTEKFPGINLRLLTLAQNFNIPIVRELLLNCGICSCSRKSCDTLLKRGPGSAICLVVGGAAEALEAEAGTYRLVLKRKGFVRVAIDNSCDLVPVIAFGETDAFYTIPAGSWQNSLLYQAYRESQELLKRTFGFVIPLFWGRYGFMPRRIPIRVVTGEPISVIPFQEQQGLRGEELVDAVHAAYIAAVRKLFDDNKGMSGTKIKEELRIV